MDTYIYMGIYTRDILRLIRVVIIITIIRVLKELEYDQA